MKKFNLVLLALLCVIAVSATVYAANTKERSTTKSAKDVDSASLREKNREKMTKMRQERIATELAKQKKTHDEYVGKLTAIKEMAEKEEATKTAKMIENLINAENKEFDKKIELFKKRVEAGNRPRPNTKPNNRPSLPKPVPPKKQKPEAPAQG